MDKIELKQIRKRMGWSLAQLGEYLEVSLFTVRRMEKGISPIRRPTKLAMRELRKKVDKIEKIMAD